MDKIRFGVVGSGYFGGELARIVGGMEEARLVAVHGGSRAVALAEELGCEAEERLEDLTAREDIDAIIVASPSHVHREAVMHAAKHGKHVFCEKPVALSAADCEEMLRACREAGVLFMAGHIMHFMNGVRQTKAWIRDGKIGKPILCHAERTGWEEKQATVSWKKNVATSGGHLFHHIHELDLVQAIMGPAEGVYMAGGNLAHSGEGFGDEEDALLLTLDFPGGALGTMQYGSGFRYPGHFIRINGTEGAILLDLTHSEALLKKNGDVTVHPLHDTNEENRERAASYLNKDEGVSYGTAKSKLPGWLSNLMKQEMACFRDAVQGKPIAEEFRSLIDGTAAISSVRTAETAMASLRAKQWLPVGRGREE